MNEKFTQAMRDHSQVVYNTFGAVTNYGIEHTKDVADIEFACPEINPQIAAISKNLGIELEETLDTSGCFVNLTRPNVVNMLPYELFLEIAGDKDEAIMTYNLAYIHEIIHLTNVPDRNYRGFIEIFGLLEGQNDALGIAAEETIATLCELAVGIILGVSVSDEYIHKTYASVREYHLQFDEVLEEAYGTDNNLASQKCIDKVSEFILEESISAAQYVMDYAELEDPREEKMMAQVLLPTILIRILAPRGRKK